MQKSIIICPLYNDDASFDIFIKELEKNLTGIADQNFSLLIINDGSLKKPELKSSLPLTVLHLHKNLGHQKAIAIGLSFAHSQLAFDNIIIMDIDGEDNPRDVSALLQAFSQTNTSIVAHRASRQNGKRFKWFYTIYKFLFGLLTGEKISFGNFMILKKEDVSRLVYTNEIWNHLAGTIIKSKMPYTIVATHRGKRYSGESKMSFTSLLLHGLAAIGVFIEIIAIRLLIFSVIMICLSILAMLLIVGVRFFTNTAIPGWATTAFSSMLIVLLQSCLLSLFTIFLYLSSQSQRQFIPANHYKDYVASVEEL
jgi:hypothetical protein